MRPRQRPIDINLVRFRCLTSASCARVERKRQSPACSRRRDDNRMPISALRLIIVCRSIITDRANALRLFTTRGIGVPYLIGETVSDRSRSGILNETDVIDRPSTLARADCRARLALPPGIFREDARQGNTARIRKYSFLLFLFFLFLLFLIKRKLYSRLMKFYLRRSKYFRDLRRYFRRIPRTRRIRCSNND